MGMTQVISRLTSLPLRIDLSHPLVGFASRSEEHLVYEEPSLLHSRRKMIRHNVMVQMLMERTVLADTVSNRIVPIASRSKRGKETYSHKM